MGILTPAEYRILLRQDFSSFVQRCFYELNPQASFSWSWHIEVMAAKLAACRDGKIKRLIINIPPRHLKSLCASIALPGWWLGHHPTAQILCASYGQDLSDKLSRDCRTIMGSTWYQRLFPTRLSAQKQSLQEFVTTQQGFRFATSVGGVLTGRGGDVIIIDDPLKPDEALSDTQRKAVNEWYDHTLLSRLNNKQTGCIILIMQRLHEDDLVGHVLEQEAWDLVAFPAIAEQDETHLLDETPLGQVKFSRRRDEVLHADREPPETLARIRAALGEYNFAGQYQQAPAPLGGGLVKEAWFKRFEPHELPAKFDQVVQSWDTANKPTELSDYSVCTTWGVKDKHFYLLNVLRKRLDYPSLKRAVQQQWQAFDAKVILIEDKASGTQLIQDLIEERLHAVTRYLPGCDKIMRLNAQTGAIENGFVHVPQEAHWLDDYLHELTTFPASRYDDQVDSTSQFLDWNKWRPPGWGILEFYRQQAEALRKPVNSAKVRLKPPSQISTFYTIDGRNILAGPDGTFELSIEDAKPLLAAGSQLIPDGA
jgi:predicted phage terminase large subunit-like protein